MCVLKEAGVFENRAAGELLQGAGRGGGSDGEETHAVGEHYRLFPSSGQLARSDDSSMRAFEMLNKLPQIAPELATIHPELCWHWSTAPHRTLLTKHDLPSHAINHILGLVADPRLEDLPDILHLP